MRSLGIAVKPSATSVRVRCVVLTGTQASPTLVTAFEITAPCKTAEQVGPMLGDVANGLATRLPGITPDRVAIARANVSNVGSRHESRLRRLLVEGALAATAHLKCPQTLVDHRSELAGRITGTADVPATIASLVEDDYADAATGALAMLDP